MKYQIEIYNKYEPEEESIIDDEVYYNELCMYIKKYSEEKYNIKISIINDEE